eukprot:TRINITY_DN11826_c0_g1_i1.p1 TRINITY_DN11826_c0_g1~~TRINITY_DN11826_c0_g1_i1.p1  ORF type:complete len:313 (+),score=60.08 TRINITY_DN11826_c0_g1_i1:135-1073(+)
MPTLRLGPSRRPPVRRQSPSANAVGHRTRASSPLQQDIVLRSNEHQYRSQPPVRRHSPPAMIEGISQRSLMTRIRQNILSMGSVLEQHRRGQLHPGRFHPSARRRAPPRQALSPTAVSIEQRWGSDAIAYEEVIPAPERQASSSTATVQHEQRSGSGTAAYEEAIIAPERQALSSTAAVPDEQRPGSGTAAYEEVMSAPERQALSSTAAVPDEQRPGSGTAAYEEVISAPPRLRLWPALDLGPLGSQCAVCLTDSPEGAVELQCGNKHRFHLRCIQGWANSVSRASCPLCRASVTGGVPMEGPGINLFIMTP